MGNMCHFLVHVLHEKMTLDKSETCNRFLLHIDLSTVETKCHCIAVQHSSVCFCESQASRTTQPGLCPSGNSAPVAMRRDV